MRGFIELELNKRASFRVFGGPIWHAPKGGQSLNVNMTTDLVTHANVTCAVPDFKVPSQAQVDTALRQIVPELLAGKAVYVGCGAGQGRTGLMLAILAKLFLPEDHDPFEPIAQVRREYLPVAVETPPQEKFVMAYEAPADVRAMLAKARRKAWWKFWQSGNLTDDDALFAHYGEVNEGSGGKMGW